jgi:predicted type IV restriction endonuclease
MNKSKMKKKKAQQEPKLSFGSALKKNVKIILIIIFFTTYSSEIQTQQAKKLKVWILQEEGLEGLMVHL